MRLTKEEKSSLKKRTEEKISEIESFLTSLLDIRPDNLEEYQRNEEKRLACERLCEILSEAIVDLAILIIRYAEILYNEEDAKAFVILFKNKIISEELSYKFRNLKGMRDHIAHRYGEIDNALVFNAINSEMEEDINRFLDISKKIISEDSKNY